MSPESFCPLGAYLYLPPMGNNNELLLWTALAPLKYESSIHALQLRIYLPFMSDIDVPH